MRINLSKFLILILVFPCVSYTKDIHIQGMVFRDENQNGIKDLQEPGLGGIKLRSEGKIFRTDESGRFSQTVNIEDEFSSIIVDEEMLPAGSRLTTAPSFVINKNNMNFSNTNFGIFYKTEVFDYPKTQIHIDKNISKKGFIFEVGSHQLYLNGVSLLKYPASLKDAGVETLRLPLNENGEIVDKKKLDDFLNLILQKKIQNEVTELVLEVSKPLKTVEDTHELDKTATRYEADLKKKLSVRSLKKILGYKTSQLVITARLGERSPALCRIYFGPTTFVVEPKKPYQLELMKEDKVTFEAECPGKISKIHVDIIDEHFIAKVDKKTFGGEIVLSEAPSAKSQDKTSSSQGISLEQNLHLKDNRDHYAQFFVTSRGLKSYAINGRTFKASDTPQPYLHSGESGKNTLRLSMLDLNGNEKVSKHQFNLFQQRKFYLSVTLDSYDLRSRSSKFNFNYDIPTEKRLNLSTLYFLNSKWGLSFNHIRDLSQQTTELAGGGTDHYQRTETQVHGIYRFKILDQGYFAPVLHLYAGFQMKDTGLPKDSLFHFPKTFKGLSLGGELLKENFFTPQVASSTALFVGYQNSDNRTLRFSQEFRINLNHLGKLFSAKKEYIYGPTYRGWNNLRLVLGMNYEVDEREAENVTARISDKTIAYRAGLAFQF